MNTPPSTQTGPSPTPDPHRTLLWAFVFGNWVIGAGVMLVPGMLAIMARDLGVGVPTAGALIGLAAAVMCVGSPVFATLTSRADRRTLLTIALAWYAATHALCALAPNYAWLLPMRVVAVFAAAVFTPQAAATLSLVLPTERRASGITFIFIGWSLASVVALPVAAWVGAQFGWRAAFLGFSALAALSAVWVWRVVPAGLRGTPLSRASWEAVARHPGLVAILCITAISATGQFTSWAYIAPLTQHLLQPSPAVFSVLLFTLGIAGLAGNIAASRNAARPADAWLSGAPSNVHIACATMALGTAIVGIAGSSYVGYGVGLCMWGAGVFASNSSNQARLAAASPELASASIALNTSMIYLGQAAGTFIGGSALAQLGESRGYALLPWISALGLVGATLLSLRATRIVRAWRLRQGG